MSILIATLSQHQTNLNKEPASPVWGGRLEFSYHAMIWAFFHDFQADMSASIILGTS
jgi:hypothetical protein